MGRLISMSKIAPWEGEEAALRTEVTTLQQQQRDTLKVATYLGMTAQDAQEYERRSIRITEILARLGINHEPGVDERW